MNPNTDHSELKELILENQKLLAENNMLLKKMHKSARRHFWFNMVYIFAFLVLPIIMYYYYLAPYLDTFESLMPGSSTIHELDALRNLSGSAWQGIK